MKIAPRPAPRILLVEDDAVVAMDVRSSLEGSGYHVQAMAATGEQAVREAEKARPDLLSAGYGAAWSR